MSRPPHLSRPFHCSQLPKSLEGSFPPTPFSFSEKLHLFGLNCSFPSSLILKKKTLSGCHILTPWCALESYNKFQELCFFDLFPNFRFNVILFPEPIQHRLVCRLSRAPGGCLCLLPFFLVSAPSPPFFFIPFINSCLSCCLCVHTAVDWVQF